jgi:hypothetical protein
LKLPGLKINGHHRPCYPCILIRGKDDVLLLLNNGLLPAHNTAQLGWLGFNQRVTMAGNRRSMRSSLRLAGVTHVFLALVLNFWHVLLDTGTLTKLEVEFKSMKNNVNNLDVDPFFIPFWLLDKA